MDKYCVFNKNMYDGEQLVWEKGKKYKINFEDEKTYYFKKLINNIDYGIDKQSENKLYVVIME
jgi:hypothetical protein